MHLVAVVSTDSAGSPDALLPGGLVGKLVGLRYHRMARLVGVLDKKEGVLEEELATVPAKRKALPSTGRVLRANRQKRLRADTVSAGLELFLKYGYENVTVADIAERVDISRRTFFRHFQSKDDVVFDWMDQLGELVESMLVRSQPSEPPLQVMRNTFVSLAEHLVENGDRTRALVQLIFGTPSLTGRYHEEHARWEDKQLTMLMHGRTLSPAEIFQVRVQVAAAITAFVVAIRTWAEKDSEQTLQEWVMEAFSALSAE